MASTAARPVFRADTLSQIEALFSQIAPPLAPIQFTGTTTARYNMGGGQPDPASLPRQELVEIVSEVLGGEQGVPALFYGDAQGFLGLRQFLAEKLQRWEQLDVSPDELLIVNGSNHGLALAIMGFVNPGEVAIVEAPSFLGGLRPLRQVGAKMEMVPLDGDGVQTDLLELRLQRLWEEGTPAKLLYTIPNFHNPAGVCLSLRRRRRLVELAEEFNFVVLEDDAYGELRFSGTHIPAVYGLAPKGRVIRSATLSKILAAGLRVGYLSAPAEVIRRLSSLKLDSGASQFTGRVAAAYLRQYHDQHVRQLAAIYREKRDALVRGLERGFTSDDPLRPSWYLPEGGFFLWLRLSGDLDPARVAQAAGARGIGYVPGPAFYADGSGSEYVRLAWSMLPPAELEVAGQLLCEAIRAAGEVRE